MVNEKIKPTSVRIPKNLLEKIDSICNDANCSRNDYIASALDEAVNNEIDETENQDSSKETEVNKYESHYDKFGNYWSFDKNQSKWCCKINPENVRITY